MPAERYYIKNELQAGHQVYLETEEFHHLANVMRAEVDDEIELVNGQGSLAVAKIQRMEKKRALLSIEEAFKEAKQSEELILAQAIPRIHRLDNILEKGTELGMTQLWLFPGELSERKELKEHQVERFKAITIAAMKQCGRLYLPEIVLKPKLSKWENLPWKAFFGDIDPHAKPLSQIWNVESSDSGIMFFVGPEGGFSIDEESILQRLGARGVKLHKNILRTDTAALVCLSLISQKLL